MGAYQFLAVENVEIVERGGNGFNRVENVDNVEWGLVLRVPVVPVVPGPGAADHRGLLSVPLDGSPKSTFSTFSTRLNYLLPLGWGG